MAALWATTSAVALGQDLAGSATAAAADVALAAALKEAEGPRLFAANDARRPPRLSADEARGHTASKKPKAAKQEKPAPEHKADSEENRVGKRGVVLGEIGLIDLLHSAYGIDAGYFLTPDRVLEFDYAHGDFAFLGLNSKIDLATVRVKQFLGNSFYVQGGAGYRRVQSTATNDVFGLASALGANVYTSDFQASHLVGEFGLGNRWQFSGFTIGCDWIGYIQPLTKLSSAESFTGSASDEQKASDRTSFEKTSGSGNLLLVRFHLGWAF